VAAGKANGTADEDSTDAVDADANGGGEGGDAPDRDDDAPDRDDDAPDRDDDAPDRDEDTADRDAA
jgi:hypothetical protein